MRADVSLSASVAAAAAALIGAVSPPAFALGTWSPTSAPFGERYDDIFFVSPLEGWAGSALGQILHTTDGGDTWTIQFDHVDTYIRSLGFVDAQKGWAGTLNSAQPLLATTDGGQTWTPVSNLPDPAPVGICGIDVVDENVMFAVGVWSGPAYVLRTIDGGQTWSGTEFPSTTAVGLVDVRFTSPTDGIVVGGVGADLFLGNARILATADGGDTWIPRFTGTIPGTWCWKISFPSDLVGYISLERLAAPHLFLKSTDGGENWSQVLFVNGAREQGIGFIDEDIGWIGGPAPENPTFITMDGGTSWAVDGFGVELNRFQFFGDAVGYAGGDVVYKYVDQAVSVSDAPPAPEHLTRSYPNPFRPRTTIAYSLPTNTSVRVFVADPGGRKVRTLAEGPARAGDHTIEWDGKDDAGREVAAGIYLYVVQSDVVNAMGKLVRID